MRKFGHENEIVGFNGVPNEVIEIANGYLHTLDMVYGVDRDVDSEDGGYVVILEYGDSADTLKEIGIDIDRLTPEYSEIVQTSSGERWSNTFVLFNNEFALNLLMPIEITPKDWREC